MGRFFHDVNIIMGGRQDHWVAYADRRGVDPLEAKLSMARPFLTALYGAYDSGYVELRVFPPRGVKAAKQTCQDFFDLTENGWQTALIARAFELEYEGNDIYVGVLPRMRKRGQSQDVGKAAVLWADCDGKSISPAQVKAQGGDTADVIVQSGNGLHLYWNLPDVRPAESITGALQSIQRKVGSDRVHDLPRVLRMVGCSNFKNPEDPKCVRLLKCPDYAILGGQ